MNDLTEYKIIQCLDRARLEKEDFSANFTLITKNFKNFLSNFFVEIIE